MGRFVNRVGIQYGRGTVVRRLPNKGSDVMWELVCLDGVVYSASSSSLVSGNTQSCGCLQRERASQARLRDLTGSLFGRLVVIEVSRDRSPDGRALWVCRCSCGTTVSVSSHYLLSGDTRSCGCLHREMLSDRSSGALNPMYGMKGNKHPNWRGGVTPLAEAIRKCLEYKAWRKAVFERDKHTCQLCGDSRGGNLVADHIYAFSWILEDHEITSMEQALQCAHLWDVLNGRTLCEECHEKTDNFAWKAIRR